MSLIHSLHFCNMPQQQQQQQSSSTNQWSAVVADEVRRSNETMLNTVEWPFRDKFCFCAGMYGAPKRGYGRQLCENKQRQSKAKKNKHVYISYTIGPNASRAVLAIAELFDSYTNTSHSVRYARFFTRLRHLAESAKHAPLHYRLSTTDCKNVAVSD